MSFDDNALFRRHEIAELRDKTQGDPREIAAGDHGLSYIGLKGDIGCMINGAGLAMATMDMIKLAGGEPANFLDVGGGASAERTEKAFRLVLADKGVKAILVNIFAGINRCDWIAEGLCTRSGISICRSRWSCAYQEQMSRKVVASLLRAALPIITAERWRKRPRKLFRRAMRLLQKKSRRSNKWLF